MACQWTGAETQLPLQPNLMGLINAVFDELEAAYGQVEVSHTLGYLTAAKHGLSDSEMIDILSCDEAVLEKIFVHCTPPEQVGQRCQEAGPVYEAGVEEGKDRYVLDQPTKYRGSNMSKISVQSLFSRHNRRKLDELPYQVLQLRGRILEEFVLKFDWVYEKLCGSDTYQVLEDVSLALRNHSNNIELVLLKEVLEARRLRPRIRRKAVLLAGKGARKGAKG
ncbi:NACHT and WD repeat domain-containing protein 1 [Penaeus vannamei]|uniref:NACHT and WD repeat domain-containing protein 1 n=1 Tax=Penaeus vannamei TaxID=6689 RepID=A0A3R7QFS2_PENVA|nr:NACHT and WD repeat domain-containing protein 1 [Penaeus vannamei]